MRGSRWGHPCGTPGGSRGAAGTLDGGGGGRKGLQRAVLAARRRRGCHCSQGPACARPRVPSSLQECDPVTLVAGTPQEGARTPPASPPRPHWSPSELTSLAPSLPALRRLGHQTVSPTRGGRELWCQPLVPTRGRHLAGAQARGMRGRVGGDPASSLRPGRGCRLRGDGRSLATRRRRGVRSPRGPRFTHPETPANSSPPSRGQTRR